MRLLLGSFTDNQWTGVYKQAYESVYLAPFSLTQPIPNNTTRNLTPGGWVEQLEGSLPVQCDDKTLNPDGAHLPNGITVGKAFASSGKLADTIDHMRTRIEAAGFIDIQEKTYKIPVGSWAKNRRLKEAGRFNKMQFAAGMEGGSCAGGKVEVRF